MEIFLCDWGFRTLPSAAVNIWLTHLAINVFMLGVDQPHKFSLVTVSWFHFEGYHTTPCAPYNNCDHLDTLCSTPATESLELLQFTTCWHLFIAAANKSYQRPEMRETGEERKGSELEKFPKKHPNRQICRVNLPLAETWWKSVAAIRGIWRKGFGCRSPQFLPLFKTSI